MQDRNVIDFTDMSSLSKEEKSRFYDLIAIRRKSYECSEMEDGSITVSIENIANVHYECIYTYKKPAEVFDMIKKGESLDLKGCYIKDFDISKIDNHEKYEIMGLDADFSFWDGDVNFSRATFSRLVSFSCAKFGDGSISFESAKFLSDVWFDYANFGNGDKDFSEARFKENADFVNAIFGDGRVSFEQTTYGEGYIEFSMAEFGKGDVSFRGASFGDCKYLSVGGASFGDGDVIFLGVTIGKGKLDGFRFADFGEGQVLSDGGYLSDYINRPKYYDD